MQNSTIISGTIGKTSLEPKFRENRIHLWMQFSAKLASKNIICVTLEPKSKKVMHMLIYCIKFWGKEVKTVALLIILELCGRLKAWSNSRAMFVCLFGFLTSSSTTRLYRGRAPRQERLTILRAATHETELGDHGFCFSRSHYTDTDPTSRERAATAGIEPGTSWPGVARSTYWASAPPSRAMWKTVKAWCCH